MVDTPAHLTQFHLFATLKAAVLQILAAPLRELKQTKEMSPGPGRIVGAHFSSDKDARNLLWSGARERYRIMVDARLTPPRASLPQQLR